MWLFKSDNERNIKKLKVIADKVDALDSTYQKMTNDELRAQTEIFIERLNKGETLNDILPEAFATCREACWRVLNKKPFYVQLIGGIAIHQGRIAEMKTGEGKTSLTVPLPAYLNALTKKGVHIVTVNEYLAKRDSERMDKIFKFLGLTVGLTLSQMDAQKKKDAYNCDITYGTNSEFGFDYLRDNMMQRKEDKMQRGHNFAVVDEVDSVLIDEARTPLIISGGRGFKSNEMFGKAATFARTLKKAEDLDIDEKQKSIRLTESGITKAERFFGVENLSDFANIELNHYIKNAIRAQYMMFLNSHYIINDKNEIMIVDEFTGRVMQGRRFSDGLHQAIEAKEGVKINDDNLAVATITYQNYFRLYKKLSGMTGTAKTEELEFNKIYNLDVVTIPTNMPVIRKDYPDIVYSTKKGKFNGIINLIKEKAEKGQPMLIGTTTVDKSEELSNVLTKQKVKHVVLNAKNHEKESEIVAQAGKVGAVTIATNMAGRGTDILLGGNAEYLAKQKMKNEGFEDFYINESTSYTQSDDEKVIEAKNRFAELNTEFEKQTEEEKKKVIELGGLCIIGTERHESRRIDNQLRGRAGRQGDIGESVFFLSLEDDLARVFGGERLKSVATFFKMSEDEPLFQMKMISKQIENAQKKIEAKNFSARKTLLSFDDVMNVQRGIIYGQRDKVLEGADIHAEVVSMIEDLVYNAINGIISDDIPNEEWNYEKLNTSLEESIFPKETNFVTYENVKDMEAAEVVDYVTTEVLKRYNEKAEQVKNEIAVNFADLERFILLKCVDNAWMEHIDAMTMLKNEIFTRQDPINAYKQEGSDMFDQMISTIRQNTAKYLINSQIEKVVQNKPTTSKEIMANTKTGGDGSKIQKTVRREKKEPGRNDPCPCGSGKKYKHCCGK